MIFLNIVIINFIVLYHYLFKYVNVNNLIIRNGIIHNDRHG